MALDDILSRIAEETEAEARAIAERAAAEADGVLREAEREAEEVRRAGHERAHEAEEREERRATIEAELAAKRAVLSARREAVEAALDAAREALASAPADAYAKTIRSLLASRDAAREGWEEILVPGRHAREIHGPGDLGLSADVRVTGSDDPGFQGAVLRRGAVRLNLTWTTVLRGVRESAELALPSLLFREEETLETRS